MDKNIFNLRNVFSKGFPRLRFFRRGKPQYCGGSAEKPDRETELKKDPSNGRQARGIYAISAYVGSNGSGKTLAMVHDTLPSVYSGRDVYTTVPITYPDGTTPPNVHILTEWSQILNATHADILLDEVSAICSSRDTEALPPQVATLLQQLRKHDLVLRWTAPSWQRADRILRETTKVITICHGYFPHRVDNSHWSSNRAFIWRTFDASDYTDFSSLQSARKRLRALQTSFYMLTKTRLAPRCYDTYGAVHTIGTVLMSGRCAVCGGRRRVPDCSCQDYRHGKK